MHLPRKRFGQHFLHDAAIIHRIITALAPHAHEHLVEIGPGQGALTVPVLQIVKELEAVELDRDLIPELQKRCREGTLHIHSADALTFDFAQLKKDERLLRVFGNLPYNISTPLIFHLLLFTPLIANMLFMLQKEVAARLAAKTNTHDYSRLSVMVQYHCQVELLFDVPPSAFYPPPKVTSSIVQLVPFQTYPYLASNYALFSSVVKQAFNQRRKTLRNSLKSCMDDEKWERVSISSDKRPENCTVKDFVDIANVLDVKTS